MDLPTLQWGVYTFRHLHPFCPFPTLHLWQLPHSPKPPYFLNNPVCQNRNLMLVSQRAGKCWSQNTNTSFLIINLAFFPLNHESLTFQFHIFRSLEPGRYGSVRSILNHSARVTLQKFNRSGSESPIWRQAVKGQTQKLIPVVPKYIRYLSRF